MILIIKNFQFIKLPQDKDVIKFVAFISIVRASERLRCTGEKLS